MLNRLIVILSISLFIFTSCEKKTEEDLTGMPVVTMETILTDYEIIWGMDFIPNGDLIFGEKRGKLYRKSNETVTEITGFPQVLSAGQGGLLDIRVHPDYEDNGWVYACYSASNPAGGALLKLVRFKIAKDQVQDIENIFMVLKELIEKDAKPPIRNKIGFKQYD